MQTVNYVLLELIFSFPYYHSNYKSFILHRLLIKMAWHFTLESPNRGTLARLPKTAVTAAMCHGSVTDKSTAMTMCFQ